MYDRFALCQVMIRCRAVTGSFRSVFYFILFGPLKPKFSVCKVLNSNQLKQLKLNQFKLVSVSIGVQFLHLEFGLVGLLVFFFFSKSFLFGLFLKKKECSIQATFFYDPFMLFVIKPFLETCFRPFLGTRCGSDSGLLYFGQQPSLGLFQLSVLALLAQIQAFPILAIFGPFYTSKKHFTNKKKSQPALHFTFFITCFCST